ncbi:MAG: phosphate acetyltransferase [Atopobiaceae bacterium]|nr:phosphate acetyltransferase [Atopobiaceae bacterium]MCH4119185.1 phosphate acetyltransferase [Atopobiaceae bacterium]MCI1318279.1 phosphate acetyltransferase [Atopobiaceae bacterium]MCI1388555.1 phosphate acetyltransferase [Atopobiaceae bacterium]MCI1432054.1 phosphate acetyltransferase [Atopobiaceae bacterium]
MSKFLDSLKARAAADKKTIVMPEGEDARVRVAAKQVVEEGFANIVILGDPNEIKVVGCTTIDPKTSDKHEAYAQKFAELRAKKGVTIEQARKTMDDPVYFGTMMVKMGDADGMVSGATHYTADTLRPALQILKTAPGVKIVSGWMLEVVPDCVYGQDGVVLLADVGLNEYPDADKLSEIAIGSAKSWRDFMGTEPYVAMLSYSTYGSAKHERVDLVREATELVRKKAPEIKVDGEMQLDAALSDRVADQKAPGSPVGGRANVLIFPNLDAGNIGYKLIQRFGKAEAFGPLLQGLARPVNDLSRGSLVADIVGTVAVTCIQAQQIED